MVGKLLECTKYKNHVLKELDFGEDGIWPMLQQEKSGR